MPSNSVAEWVRFMNANHRKHGETVRDVRSMPPGGRLREEQHVEIRRLHALGVPGKRIAWMLKVSRSTVSDIVNGKRKGGVG